MERTAAATTATYGEDVAPEKEIPVSKKLSLVALVLAALAVTFADIPRGVSVTAAALVGLLVVVAYARSFVAWVAAGTHYGA